MERDGMEYNDGYDTKGFAFQWVDITGVISKLTTIPTERTFFLSSGSFVLDLRYIDYSSI